MVGELITYLDRRIAFRRILGTQLGVPNGVDTVDGIRGLIQARLEHEYGDVAKDRRLSSPKKLALFPGIDKFANEAALSYFSVRRAIEHYGGRSHDDIALRFGRLKFLAGDTEITRSGQAAAPGVGISVGMDHASREIPAMSEVSIREDELEHIAFTIQHLIAPEVVRAAREQGAVG
jgi:hypothetical protein